MVDNDLKRQIEEAARRLESWPDKDEDLVKLLPKQGVCSLCYLADRTEQPRHDLVLLCPQPYALLVPYRWSDGRLRAGPSYMADKSAFVDMVKSVLDGYAGENPAATRRWMRLHSAASDLLKACELAIQALSGFEDEDKALASLRSAVAEAQG